MADERNHVFFRNPQEGVTKFRQLIRDINNNQNDDDDDEQIDYTLKQRSFEESTVNFRLARTQREQKRNPALNIRAHQDYIIIDFHNSFDPSFFASRYRNNFGMSLISLWELNTIGLFAIVDQRRFASFEAEIAKFINNDNPAVNVNYHPDIRFIQYFSLLSTDRIIGFEQVKRHVIINLVDNAEIFQTVVRPVESLLLEYLEQQKIQFYFDLRLSKIELIDASAIIIQEISDNFDIIQSINSLSAGVIRPNRFNMPERTFGFEITNADEELPIIGVLDTGISNQNPLAPLIINDPAFDLTNTSPVTDNVNHGTGVGAFAALGDRLIPTHLGQFESDARLLPIKIMDGDGRPIPELEVIRLIREAHKTHGVQIFTLTICYTEHKKYNEAVSEYAYAIDRLTNELNILIFIAIANNRDLSIQQGLNQVVVTYPEHFENESANLCSPAESMNNITIGALADNFENNTLSRISPPGNVPAIYSRTFHLDWTHPAITRNKKNKLLFKPDICYSGGDYDHVLDPTDNGLKVLSAQEGMFYDRDAGTSLAAPLAANIAAKILRRYPSLGDNMQSVKALLINTSIAENHSRIFNWPITKQTHVLGNGSPDADSCLFSSKDKVTFILDDEITPGEIKAFPIELPAYLLDLNKNNGLLTVDATLCFKFDPVKNNQIAYCPIHISFGIFKNLPLEEYQLDQDGNILKINDKPVPLGINGNKVENYKFNRSWSQDYYFKAKFLSNVQKMSFNMCKEHLITENRVFKIAVLSRIHKLLTAAEAQPYEGSQPFSLVITVRENPIDRHTTGRFYDEMLRINDLEVINDIDQLEAEL